MCVTKTHNSVSTTEKLQISKIKSEENHHMRKNPKLLSNATYLTAKNGNKRSKETIQVYSVT